MDEDVMNQQVRAFLKRTGINAQREIEAAVRKALDEGRLKGDERLSATMTLRVPELEVELTVAGDIALV